MKKKILLFLTPLIVAVVVFFSFELFLSDRFRGPSKGALQVTSNPNSKAYLNGQFIGQTPLCKCEPSSMIDTGEYQIRLVPNDSQFSTFEDKITIARSVLTVVDRTFGKGATSEGSIITLSQLDKKKGSELLVISFPDGADIFVDNNQSKKTPTLLTDLTPSDHEIKLSKTGYKEKVVRIRTIDGYKLTTTVFLGIDLNAASKSAEVKTDENQQASSSAKNALPKVLILSTPIGYLRVRQGASIATSEIGQVTPGESFDLVEEKVNWYKIKLKNGKEGWVSAQYAQKQ